MHSQSKIKVSELLSEYNNKKQSFVKSFTNSSVDVYKSFTFPTVTRSRVPRHWLNFVEESISELASVTNNVYDGQVAKGVRQGLGQIVLPNGDVYKGQWKSDLRHGAGLCKFGETGAIFKGEWRDGKPNGNGILFSLPNEIIEGRFDGFKIIDGQVKILFTNGEYYEGNFKNNHRNSTGIHYYANADFYDGEWQNDKRIGRGRIFAAGGGKLNGMFIEDKADGFVEFEDKDGNMFQTENDEAKAVKKVKKGASDVGANNPGSFINGKLYQ